MSMDWTEVQIIVSTADTDEASAIANMVVPYGIYVEDYSDLEQKAREIARIDLIDEELLGRDRTHSIIHIYLEPQENPTETVAFLRERLAACGIESTVNTTQVSEQDWANNWKQYFKPLSVGEKLLICPTWETVDDTAGRIKLSIDPGMAFGTGGHDTTRMVLETVEKYITPDADVLDVGCGSGILSIATLLLGNATGHFLKVDPFVCSVQQCPGAFLHEQCAKASLHGDHAALRIPPGKGAAVDQVSHLTPPEYQS